MPPLEERERTLGEIIGPSSPEQRQRSHSLEIGPEHSIAVGAGTQETSVQARLLGQRPPAQEGVV
jgi:hypothetical protein